MLSTLIIHRDVLMWFPWMNETEKMWWLFQYKQMMGVVSSHLFQKGFSRGQEKCYTFTWRRWKKTIMSGLPLTLCFSASGFKWFRLPLWVWSEWHIGKIGTCHLWRHRLDSQSDPFFILFDSVGFLRGLQFPPMVTLQITQYCLLSKLTLRSRFNIIF
jgi:hypothetical protein